MRLSARSKPSAWLNWNIGSVVVFAGQWRSVVCAVLPEDTAMNIEPDRYYRSKRK